MRVAAESQGHTLGEEIANTLTHALGVMFAVAAFAVLIGAASADAGGTPLHLAALATYGTTLVLLYCASTLYHIAWGVRIKRVLKVVDHSAIFLLIAGTYTPLCLIAISGPVGVWLCLAVWVLAAAGVTFKLVHRSHGRRVVVAISLVMGWLGVVALIDVWASLPTAGFVWLGVGGVIYTAGVVFYVWDRMPFNHAVWHLFVLAGSACHFMAIWLTARPGLV